MGGQCVVEGLQQNYPSAPESCTASPTTEYARGVTFDLYRTTSARGPLCGGQTLAGDVPVIYRRWGVEKYDIAESAERASTAIEKMRATVRPGARTGRGGKAAVLRVVREQLRVALNAEYTVPQLVDALREVFGGKLTAKTVRAALRDGAASTTKRRRQRKTTGVAAAPAPATAAPTASPPRSSHDAPAPGPAQSPSEKPPADPVAPPDAGAKPPTAGTVAVPFTKEQRAQHGIPEWADGSDLRPGEMLDRYAVRKRVAGPPKGEEELRKFIGEGRRRDP